MSGGRIVLLILGILFLLGSVSLLFGGGVLLWVDTALKDDDGFFTTEPYQLERDSYAIVTKPADMDMDEEWSWDWFGDRDLGEMVTIKVEGSNRHTSKGIFIGVAEESGLSDYLNDVEYDEIIDFSIHDDELDVEYERHHGTLEPAVPMSQTFWTASTDGTGARTLEWEPKEGTYALALMNADGSRGIDADVALGVKVPVIFWIGVGLLIAGIVALIIGILMVIFALRGRKSVKPSQPMHVLRED